MADVVHQVPLPPDELLRLQALRTLDILDTQYDEDFNDLVSVAAQVAQCPIALISLADAQRQWFKATHGIALRQASRSESFCSYAILQPAPFVVPDALLDPRFADNPFVTGATGIRFYAGHPVEFAGMRVGSLCVFDTRPRELDAGQQSCLAALARTVSALLNSRHNLDKLRQRDQLLERLSVEVPGLIFQLRQRPQGEASFPFASAAVGPMLGVSDDDVKASAAAALRCVHPDDIQDIRATLRHSAQTLTVWHGEFRVVLPGQRLQWREGHATPERLADGGTQWFGYIWDTTERKQAELSLLQSTQMTALAVQAANVGISVWAAQDNTLELDALALDMFGLPAGSGPVAIDRWLDCLEALERQRAEPLILQAASAQRPLALLLYVVHPVLGMRHVEMHMRPILDKTRGSYRIVSAYRDVTERSELHRQQLAMQAAEQASADKTAFLARVSHELRTPLNAILGFAQLLAQDDKVREDRRIHSQVDHIETAGRHLLSLVNDLLDLTRSDSGDHALNIVAVDLNAALDAAMALAGAPTGPRDVRMELQPLSGRYWVSGEPRSIQQCLINLLANALKYNRPSGRVRIVVSHRGDRVGVSISDDGPGLTDAQQARLFQPFSRVDPATGSVEGTGLGLAITKNLVDRMGGQLSVHSTVSVGSTFTIELPVAAPPDQKADAPATAVQRPLDGAPARSDSRQLCLYVEDNPLNRLVVQGFFEDDPQLRIELACDGAQCLAAMADCRPDLLLLDLHLPDGHGNELLARIRLNPAWAGIPAIAVSADALPEGIAAARAAGFADYWIKPLDAAQVRRSIARLFAARQPVARQPAADVTD